MALDALGLVLPTRMHERVIYAESFAHGKTAFEIEPHGIAALELAALWQGVGRCHEDLAGETASASAQPLRLCLPFVRGPPAACGWARSMVLSMRMQRASPSNRGSPRRRPTDVSDSENYNSQPVYVVVASNGRTIALLHFLLRLAFSCVFIWSLDFDSFHSS